MQDETRVLRALVAALIGVVTSPVRARRQLRRRSRRCSPSVPGAESIDIAAQAKWPVRPGLRWYDTGAAAKGAMESGSSAETDEPAEATRERTDQQARAFFPELGSIVALATSFFALSLSAYQARAMNEQTRLMQSRSRAERLAVHRDRLQHQR